MSEPKCVYCNKPADGPMLRMGEYWAHADCVIRRLNELLDPDWDMGREPEQIVVKKPVVWTSHRVVERCRQCGDEEGKE